MNTYFAAIAPILAHVKPMAHTKT